MAGGFEYLEEVIGQIEEHFSNHEDMEHHTADDLRGSLDESAFNMQPEPESQHENTEAANYQAGTYEDHFQEFNHEDVQPYSFAHENGEYQAQDSQYNNDGEHSYI